MKCRKMSNDAGTWTNVLAFEPDILSSPISYALQRGILLGYVGKISRIGIGRPSLQRRVVLKWFYSARAVGTTLSEVHALHRSSALLVKLS